VQWLSSKIMQTFTFMSSAMLFPEILASQSCLALSKTPQ
jgi:hypothetical protein